MQSELHNCGLVAALFILIRTGAGFRSNMQGTRSQVHAHLHARELSSLSFRKLAKKCESHSQVLRQPEWTSPSRRRVRRVVLYGLGSWAIVVIDSLEKSRGPRPKQEHSIKFRLNLGA